MYNRASTQVHKIRGDNILKRIPSTPGKWLLWLSLLVIVVLVRIPTITLPFLNDEDSFAYHAQLINQSEPLYGTHHPDHNLPAVYYTYAIVFKLFGDRPESVKLFLIPWILLNALILVQIGQKALNWKAGYIAGVIFILITSTPFLNGEMAETEQFANLPLTLGIWLILQLDTRKNNIFIAILIGMAGAISFLYKAVYLQSLAAVGGYLILSTFLEHNREAWKRLLIYSLAILGGILLILGPIAAYFAAIGLWSRLWLVFHIGEAYVNANGTPLIYVLINPYLSLLIANITLAYIGLVGFVLNILRLPKLIITDRKHGLSEFIIIVWLLASIVVAGISRYPFGHYQLLVVPPLALLVGLETTKVFDRFRQKHPLPRFNAIWIYAIILIAILANYVYSSKNYIGGYLEYLQGAISRTDFVEQVMGSDAIVGENIARFIDMNSTPNDTILAWTDNLPIYYLSKRRSSSDILMVEEVSSLGPPERVIYSKPYFVITNRAENELPLCLAQELATHYQLRMTNVKYQVYQRIAS